MELYTYTEPCDYLDYIQHHGIKGQRWGIRRYQNADGSLKPAGEKHRTLRERRHDRKVYKKRKAALEKARVAREEKKKAAEQAAKEAEERRKKLEAGKIPIKKMTDAELKWTYDRQKAEKDLKDKMIENSPGKRFVKKMYDDALVPAVTNTAKDLAGSLLKKYGEQYLGLNQKSAYDKLKEAHEMSKWKKEIQENKEWFEDTEQRRALDKSKRDADIAKNKKNERLDKDFLDNRDQELADRKDSRKAAEDAVKKAFDDYLNKKPKPDPAPYSKKGSNIPKDDLSDGKKYELAVSTTNKSGKQYVTKYTNSNRSTSTSLSTRNAGKKYVEDIEIDLVLDSDGVYRQR